MEKACPRCQSGSVVEGRIFNQPDYIDPRAFFRPNGLPFFACIGTNVGMENKFFACSDCGFIWAKADEKKIKEVISKLATRYMQKKSQAATDEVYDLGK